MLDLADCCLTGSALTEPFLREGLGRVIAIPDSDPAWEGVRTALRSGGAQRVHRHVTTLLASVFGYGQPLRQAAVTTREGAESGGWLLRASEGRQLRAWSVSSEIDLDGIDGSVRSYRSSPMRVAQRVLLARRESVGLLTNGEMVRLLLCDPAQTDSSLSIDLRGWRDAALPPDSYRLLKALASADSLAALPGILDAARLYQVRVASELRRQAKEAIVGFINALPDRSECDAATLWREGLALVYRLLFILKLEVPGDSGNSFSFASTRLWREALSPNRALGPLVRRCLDNGHDTGRMLEDGLRTLFAMFRSGLRCSELHVTALGGALFGADSTAALDRLRWGERAVAILLDRLIWTVSERGARARVHYGSLDVENLGSIYESLLEQEPGIATEPMIRVRNGKQEWVVPAGGEPATIASGQFFLRSGTGRKASGSFYTPQAFVSFLVRETLDPKIAALSPLDDPHPARLLTLKIVDPAAGSGHFLVEAGRYLGEALLTACRLCDEHGLHDRIAALPDPDQTIAAYLPSRGFAEHRARAICRRLVAVHCLYGCDRNKLAVELAKLSLWLESYAEGLPLTFLDHRLVHGDSLTGPLFDKLSTLPVTGGPLDPLLAHGVAGRLQAGLDQARQLVAELDGSIGRDIGDLLLKQQAKQRLDGLLLPLRRLAQGWTGAAMLRERGCDDVWLGLASYVAATGEWPRRLSKRQSALLAAGAGSIAWDLVFPDVFPDGFAVVLGNPPWDVVLPNTKDFVAAFEPRIAMARSRAERATIEQAVLARPAVAESFQAYRTGFERLKRVADRLYQHQRVQAGGATTAGSLDLFRLFAERAMELAAADGTVGMLMPSAFHANEGTTGIRRLYLRDSDLRWCLSFENRRRIFDIDSRFKFDLVVAQRPGPTRSLRCGFYLERIEDADDPDRIMEYDLDFLKRTGGVSLTPLELRGRADLSIAETMFAVPQRFRDWCTKRKIRFGCDLHMTADSGLFQPPGKGDLVLHEGKTFHQFTDRWETLPRYSVASAAVSAPVAEAARHYRLAFRDIARSNDERTMIACIAPPGTVFGHTATVEKAPGQRVMTDALVLCAMFNTFSFDWLVRQKAATHLSLYLLEGLPVPVLKAEEARYLAQTTLALTCRHKGYTDLAQAHSGKRRPTLRQPAALKLTSFQHQRSERTIAPADPGMLRAAADAIVAHAYGLDRDQYERLLGSFSHRSWPEAPSLCLQAFEHLQAHGQSHRMRKFG